MEVRAPSTAAKTRVHPSVYDKGNSGASVPDKDRRPRREPSAKELDQWIVE